MDFKVSHLGPSGYHNCSLRNITLVVGKRGSGILGIVRVKAMRNTVYKLGHLCAFYTMLVINQKNNGVVSGRRSLEKGSRNACFFVYEECLK